MDDGERIAAQSSWLHLLFLHLASRRLLALVDVDDLTQEVFLRALAKGASVPPAADGEVALRRYLAAAARTCVVDCVRAFRARKRDGVVVSLTGSDWSRSGPGASRLADSAAGPATLVEHSDEQRRLAAAFARLSSEHRRVIGLRQLEGLTAAAAAVRLGRTESAVHSLYRRAVLAWSELAASPR